MFWRIRAASDERPAEPAPLPRLVASGDTATGRVALAHALLCDGQYAAALAELEVALAENPELADGQLAKGLALARQQRYREAIEPLRIALEAGEQTRLVTFGLAAVCMCLDDQANALEYCRQLTASDPADAKAFAMIGEIHRRAGRADEALEAFRQATQLNPQLLVARWRLGELLAAAGQLDAAIEQLQAARQLVPTDGHVLEALAAVLRQQKQYGEAVELYQQAAQCGRPRAEQFIAIAECHLEQRRLFDAMGAIRAALALDPQLPECHRVLSRIYAAQGRQAEAQQYEATAQRLGAAPLLRANGVAQPLWDVTPTE